MPASSSIIQPHPSTQRPLILDGGMGRELHRMGAPFRQPEWSTLSLMERPDLVQQAHENFLKARADIITANSYALVPFHIGQARFAAEGEALAALSGRLGRQAITARMNEREKKAEHPAGHSLDNPANPYPGLPTPLLAGSLPPSGGSYRPDLFTPQQAETILTPLIRGLAPSVDLWLAETQGCIAELQTAHHLVHKLTEAGERRPFWGSFTLDDAQPAATITQRSPARLRSGELLADAVQAALALGLDALLFNCSDPRIMATALQEAKQTMQDWTDGPSPGMLLGVYANGFARNNHDEEGEGANESITPLDDEMTPQRYSDFARQWHKAGAGIIGGCCGIGPEHIAALSASFPPRN